MKVSMQKSANVALREQTIAAMRHAIDEDLTLECNAIAPSMSREKTKPTGILQIFSILTGSRL